MKIYVCACLVLMALNTEMADSLKQDTGPEFDTLFRRTRRSPIVSPIIGNDIGSDPDNDEDDDVIKNPGDDDNNGDIKCFDLSKDCSMELCEHHAKKGYNECRKYCGYCYEGGISAPIDPSSNIRQNNMYA